MGKNPNKCFAYREGDIYIYTIRAGNNLSNSLGGQRYKSRQGRNSAVLTEKEKDPTLIIIRGVKPPPARNTKHKSKNR